MDSIIISYPPTCGRSAVTLVALPGLGGNANSFPCRMFTALRAMGTQVYAMSYGTGVDSIPEMARNQWLNLNGLGVCGNVVLLGYSMGGFVAQEMVKQEPSRVIGLVLLSTSCVRDGYMPLGPAVIEPILRGDKPKRTDPAHDLAMLFPPRFLATLNPHYLQDELLPFMRSARVSEDIYMREVISIIEYIAYAKGCDSLSQIKGPVLIIQGLSDEVIPRESADRLAGNIPHGIYRKIIRMPGVGHGIAIQTPGQVGSDVVKWMWDTKLFQAPPLFCQQRPATTSIPVEHTASCPTSQGP